MAPSALSLGEITQAGFYGFCRSAGVCVVAQCSRLTSPPGPAADALFQERLTLSLNTEDFYVLFLTNFNRKRMCHGVLNFMEILLENNIISWCITLQWPGTWTINF